MEPTPPALTWTTQPAINGWLHQRLAAASGYCDLTGRATGVLAVLVKGPSAKGRVVVRYTRDDLTHSDPLCWAEDADVERLRRLACNIVRAGLVHLWDAAARYRQRRVAPEMP